MKYPIGKAGTSVENKTGDWRTFKPMIDRNKCTKCRICIIYCPEGCMAFGKDGKAEIDYDYCKGCGICANLCPVKCITMEKDK